MRPLMAAIALLFAFAGTALADCAHPAMITFAPGQTFTAVASGDPLPSVECYRVNAQANQDLGVFLESNQGPSLEIYAPGWEVKCDSSDDCHFNGNLLSDTGDTDWTETLTEAGAYLIVVDNPNGDDYRLGIETHPAGGKTQ